jgi:hypothetical protein
MITHDLTEPIAEKTTAKITFTLKDEADTVIPLDQIATLTLTLYNEESRTIINTRDAQNVLNLNNVTVHATSGLVTWLLQSADTSIETATKRYEIRVALFAWTFATTKSGKRQIRFKVQNLEKVT